MDELRRAQQIGQSGDLQGAARICRDLLRREPTNFFALLMLGGIESDLRNFREADKLLARAVKLNPRSPEALGGYGNVLIELGRRDEGVRMLTEAIRLQPQNPALYVYRGYAHAQAADHHKAFTDFDAAVRLAPEWEFALHNRSSALIALNRHLEARPDIEKLLRLAPNNVPVLINYASILTRELKYAEALAAIDRALAMEPRHVGLLHSRAQSLAALNRFDEALGAVEQALAFTPDDVSFAMTRANIFAALGRVDVALALFQDLMARDEGNPDIPTTCANMLMDQERLEDALVWLDRAITTKPDHAPAHVLRANLLLHLERYDESFAAYDKGVQFGNGYPEAAYHRGSALLLHGRFVEGWRDCECRWQVTDCGFSRPTLLAQEWQGEPLNGRSIVVYSEQGLGDAIQFVRFLPRLQEMGAHVTFLCHPALMRLFRNFAESGMEVVAFCRGDRRFDYQSALLSLPQCFGTTRDTVPAAVPYVFAEPELVAKWRDRIGSEPFKIGICWQGNPSGKIDRGRSVPLTEFAPVAAVPGVHLISLQRKHGLEQLANLPQGMRVETPGAFDEGNDAFVDTAAIMENLDLIVTSDTSVAHVAGALGRPVWLALRHTPDWRWMLKRSDSPWYPTMRLFRQPARGDWHTVFTKMSTQLEQMR